MLFVNWMLGLLAFDGISTYMASRVDAIPTCIQIAVAVFFFVFVFLAEKQAKKAYFKAGLIADEEYNELMRLAKKNELCLG